MRVFLPLLFLFIALEAVATADTVCTAGLGKFPLPNGDVPPIIRNEGVTELVGDLLLQCTGVPATPLGQSVLTFNFQINSTAPLSGDGLLLVGEPQPGKQVLCTNLFGCPGTGGTAGPNMFLPQVTGTNQLTWVGVPVDATAGTANVRLTNVRANASSLGLQGNIRFTVDAQTAAGFTPIPIANANQTVAFIQPGLIVGGTNASTLTQCNNLNAGFLSGGAGGANFFVNVREGFASSFKRRNVALPPDSNTLATLQPQNVPGYAYNTESGFMPQLAANPTLGQANFGTRILLRFNNVGIGVRLILPVAIPLEGGNVCAPGGSGPVPGINDCTKGWTGGYLQLLGTSDLNGVSAFTPAIPTVSFTSGVFTQSPAFSQGVLLPISAGAAVYEVINSDPTAIEQANIPVGVAFISNTAQNLPAPGTSTVNVSFAPVGTTTGAASTDIPRFTGPSSVSLPAFIINPCTGPAAFTVVSAASYGSSIAPNSFASGFGQNLTTITASTPGLPLDTTLGGYQVQVTDSKGASNLSLMHYVSPTQYNFVVPGNAATGPATVKVLSNGQVTAQGTAQIDNVAPGIFELGGIPAAQILRVKSDNTQSIEPVLGLDSAGKPIANPIVFGNPADTLYFVGYGTGFRNNSGLSSVNVQIGSTPILVPFAGAQGTYPGLDQFNAGPLPISLAGSGEKNLTLTVNGITANTVKLVFAP
jgi:uncharacterized protein (TIGR03437 family)